MRLINYGPGELSDRLTILALKILHGIEQGKDVSHFEAERASLLAQIRSRTLNGKWFESVLGLAAVNAALWHAEDALRVQRVNVLTMPGLEAVATLAFRIQALNDQRAALIERINKDAGEHTGTEKLAGGAE